MSTKKLLLGLVVVFLGFWMFTDPNGLATAASDGAGAVWTMATELFRAIIRFFGAL